MKLVTCLIFISFYHGATSAIAERRNDLAWILPTIKTVRQEYSTSAVFFGYPIVKNMSFDGLHILQFAYISYRQLARQNIFTTGIKIAGIPTVVQYYTSVVRPLITVIMLGSKDFHEFSNVTKSIKMSYAAWLIIFLPVSSYDTNCNQPPGNAFSLSFNTQMVVICKNDPILREWYSIDGKSTEITPLGKWNYDEHFHNSSVKMFKKFADISMYERRKDLKGMILRGVTVKTSYLVKLDNGKLYGYFGTAIRELEKALNFTLEIVSSVEDYGILNATTKEWTGAFDSVRSGRADIGVSDFTMTNIRLDYVDFTIPLMIIRKCLFLKQPDLFHVKWFAYYRAFHLSVWISLGVIVVISQCVLILIKSYTNSSSVMSTLYEELLSVWGIVCQQGDTEFPRQSSLRIFYVTLFLTSIVLTSAYSASLICFLTGRSRDPLFRSVDEFINDGSYDVIVVKGTADYDMFVYANDSMSVKIMKLMRPFNSLPKDTEEAFQQICEDSKLAFYSSELSKRFLFQHIPCNVFCIDCGRVDSLSMILSKDNQFTPVLNYHLQKFLSSGVLNRYKYTAHSWDSDYEMKKQPVGFGSIASLLLIFMVSVAAAFLVLLIEMCIHNYTRVEDFDQPF